MEIQKEIYNSHIKLIRTLNDTFIFVEQCFSYLEIQITDWETSQDETDYAYKVPAIKSKSKSAFRTEKEIAQIFNRFVDYELFESFLTVIVSKFESYLFLCLSSVFKKYPQKLTIKVQEIKITSDIDINIILSTSEYTSIIDKIIENRISSISYGTPKQYWKYFLTITGFEIDETMINKYIELKATRDLIIHNNSIVNNLYIEKSGNEARTRSGRIPINYEYFEQSIGLLKKLSGSISREAKTKYKERNT